MHVHVSECVCQGRGKSGFPKVTQQGIVRQAGVANHSMLPYFPEHKQKAHDVKLQPAAPPPLPGCSHSPAVLGPSSPHLSRTSLFVLDSLYTKT